MDGAGVAVAVGVGVPVAVGVDDGATVGDCVGVADGEPVRVGGSPGRQSRRGRSHRGRCRSWRGSTVREAIDPASSKIGNLDFPSLVLAKRTQPEGVHQEAHCAAPCTSGQHPHPTRAVVSEQVRSD